MPNMSSEELRALLAGNPDVRVEDDGTNAPWPARPQAQGPSPARAPLEETEQILVMKWASVAAEAFPILDLLIHVPNGGKRNPGEAARLKAAGVKAGVPDLLLLASMAGYAGLAIELKRADRSNHPTTEQLAWLARLHGEGWAVAVCYGAPEAIDILYAYVRGELTDDILEGRE